MFPRILVMILIATLVACPLCCSFGLCHPAQSCCANDSAPEGLSGTGAECQGLCHCQQRSPAHCSDDSCNAPLSQASGCEIPSDQPPCQDAPCQDSCQGICGGALACRDTDVSDQARLCISIDLIPLPILQPHDSTASALYRHQRASDALTHHGLSPGRQLRTLYMSWLC